MIRILGSYDDFGIFSHQFSDKSENYVYLNGNRVFQLSGEPAGFIILNSDLAAWLDVEMATQL